MLFIAFEPASISSMWYDERNLRWLYGLDFSLNADYYGNDITE